MSFFITSLEHNIIHGKSLNIDFGQQVYSYEKGSRGNFQREPFYLSEPIFPGYFAVN